MGTLRAVKAGVAKESKPKFMISGKSGVGKTLFSLNFPSPYYFDCESGATRQQYRKKLISSNGVYFGREQGSQDINVVIEEIKTLATTKHEYKTIVIDSFSYLYNTAAAVAEEKIGNDFGRDKKEANRPSRQLIRWLEMCDMNIILLCHSKDRWERKGKDIVYSGTTYDGFDKLEFILDLWCEIQKNGDNRSFIVKKSRIDSFPEGKEFPLDYKLFSTLYGKEIIEKESEAIKIISTEQLIDLKRLIDVMNIPIAEQDKWLEKAVVDKLEELTADQADKLITHYQKKLGGK